MRIKEQVGQVRTGSYVAAKNDRRRDGKLSQGEDDARNTMVSGNASGGKKKKTLSAQQEKRFSDLREGKNVQGKVVGIKEFGAFVDVGDGLTGLVPTREISKRHFDRIEDVVSRGDKVWVKVTKVDREFNLVDLSMNQCPVVR